VFVDEGRVAQRLIRQNIATLGAQDRATLVARNATRLGPCPGAPHTLVFCDPPYAKGLGERALAGALSGGWIAPGALVVWEESAEVSPPDGLVPLEAKRYGDTRIHLLEAS